MQNFANFIQHLKWIKKSSSKFF